MQGLAEYEAGICECGFHSSLTSNLANVFTFGVTYCNVCAGSARQQRVQQASDEKAVTALGDKPAPGMRQPHDGRKTHTRMLSPAEADEMRKR